MKVILFSISSCFIIGLLSFLPVIGGTTTEFERWIRPNNNKDNSNSADDLQYGQIQQEQELSRILSDDAWLFYSTTTQEQTKQNNEAMMLSNFVITGIVLFSAVFLFAVYCMICGGDPRAGARRAAGGGAGGGTGVVHGGGGGGEGTGVVHGVVLGVVHGDGGAGFVGGGGDCGGGGGGFGGGDCGGGGGGGDCGGGGGGGGGGGCD